LTGGEDHESDRLEGEAAALEGLFLDAKAIASSSKKQC
jgi:hypothetical protein